MHLITENMPHRVLQ